MVNCHRPCRVAGRQEDQLTSARARPLAPIRVGVTVTFTPTASGSRHAVLWIAESGGGPLVDFGIFVLGISLEYLRSLSFELQEGSFLGMQDHLNPPHGGQLINLIATPERTAQLQADSRKWPSWDLTPRQLCDLELLLNGGFSPLRGFISCADYESTCARMRLADGKIWPIPIVLDVADDFASSIGAGTSIALRDPEGVMLAALHVEEGSIPAGRVILTRLDKPFLLDFRRSLMDQAGEASLPPGMPLFQGSEPLASYLIAKSIRYVAYSYGDEVGFTRYFSYMLSPYNNVWGRTIAQSTYDVQDNLTELGKTRKRIYDDGKSFVLDLQQRDR